MKQSMKRIAVLLATVLLLCLWLMPAAVAETTPEATAEATECLCPLENVLAEGAAAPETQGTENAAPTEKPKVSAADLQAQGILTVGAKGEDVKKCQQRLKDLGYLNGKVDGQFGGGTKRAVIAFQRRNGLTTDGVAGQDTLAKLYAEDAIAAPEDVAGQQ